MPISGLFERSVCRDLMYRSMFLQRGRENIFEKSASGLS